MTPYKLLTLVATFSAHSTLWLHTSPSVSLPSISSGLACIPKEMIIMITRYCYHERAAAVCQLQ